ncbi:MAG: quinoprotein glucose dehydrogenase [Steroidobacteraceae bacterium]
MPLMRVWCRVRVARLLPAAAWLLAASVLPAPQPAAAQSPAASDWGFYGGDVFGRRFSNLNQINRGNVAKLTLAWRYRTGELGAGLASADRLSFEATPVLAFGLLYLETGTNVVLALDPQSGQLRWRFDPHIDRGRRYGELAARGVSVWENPHAAPGPCRRRVFTGTADAHLLALDADNGAPCRSFGAQGEVDLTQGAVAAGPQPVSSPPAIFRNTVIVGSGTGDDGGTGAGRGLIRGYDATSGALLWSFDPLADGPGAGAVSASGVMSVDEEHGLVLVPTGRGATRFADSLLAVDAASGRLVWAQQLVHHDLWGFDLTAQPVLGDVALNGVPVPGVIQATRTGMLYGFGRARGQPLFGVSERRVPAGATPDVELAPTQPFSALPALTAQRAVRPEDAWGITFRDRAECRARIAGLRNEGIFTPPDTRGSLLSSGYLGGVDWGGMVFDEQRQRVIAAVNHLPMVVTLLPAGEPQRHGGYTSRREPLLSSWGLPCTAPPWGTLVSVDLRRQRIVWQVPLGSSAGVTPWWLPARDFGMPNMGGPIATAGDLVFVAAATDGYLRALDIETGRELWRYKLPAGGQATPMTYRAGPTHRQYLLISAGGNGVLGTPRGDYVLAFALPAE